MYQFDIAIVTQAFHLIVFSFNFRNNKAVSRASTNVILVVVYKM